MMFHLLTLVRLGQKNPNCCLCNSQPDLDVQPVCMRNSVVASCDLHVH